MEEEQVILITEPPAPGVAGHSGLGTMKVFGFTVLNPSSHIDPSQLFSGGSP